MEQANPRYTRALEGRVFATVGELLQAAPEIEQIALKEQNYRRPPPPHQLTSPSKGWKGNDPFAHVVAARPPRTENRPDGGEKNKGDGNGKKDGSNKSAPQSNHPKHQGQLKKPHHQPGQMTKVPDRQAKPSSIGSAQAKNPAPKHKRCFTFDKEGHSMADCPDKPKSQPAKNT